MAVTKRIVAVTWTLPPIVLPRSIQVSRSMAELTRRGWDVHVITAPLDANNPAIPHDGALADIYRGTYAQTEIEFREGRQRSSAWRRFLRYHQEQRSFDDDNWIIRAASAARRLLRRKDSVFVSFAQPWIDHLVGLRLKRIRPSTRWVAHFSDPWVDSPYYDANNPAQTARMTLWRQQERAVIKHADAVVFVTAETADLVMRKYPAAWRSKVHVTPHGFDRRLMPNQPLGGEDPKAGRPLRVIYTGNIYEGRREPVPLFTVLRDMDRDGELRGRVHFDFYGNSPVATARQASDMGLDGIVSFHSSVGYLESLQLIAKADLLLLLDANADVNVFLPSKIVDYMMTGKPILGLTPPVGASASVLRKTGNLYLDPNDKATMRTTLKALIEAHHRSEPLCQLRMDAVEAFDIRRTTDSFEAALSGVIRKG